MIRNIGGGIGDFSNIFDGGSRDWNVTRQAYENIAEFAGQDPAMGARTFYLVDAGIGLRAMTTPVTIHGTRNVGGLTLEYAATVPAIQQSGAVIAGHDMYQLGSSLDSGISK